MCTHCSLDLRSPLSVDLLEASNNAAAQLDKRATLIAAIRSESFARTRLSDAARPQLPQPPLAQASALLVDDSVVATAPTGQALPPGVAPASSAPASAPEPLASMPMVLADQAMPSSGHPPADHGERRSSVQILLLSVGVALVAVALIFFLIVAFFVANTTFRAVTIALITALVFGSIPLLKRFRLFATAQGVAVLAVVLVYLDLWGAQSTNLFGAGEVSGLAFWGVSLLASSALLALWSWSTGMRAGSICAFGAVPLGAALSVAALAESTNEQDVLVTVWLALNAALAAGLVQCWAPALARKLGWSGQLLPERVLVLVQVALAAVIALALAPWIEPQSVFTPLWSFGAVALILGAHAVLSHRVTSPMSRALTAAFTALIGVTIAAIPIAISARIGGWEEVNGWPTLISVALVVVIEAARVRAQSSAQSLYLLTASSGAAVAFVPPMAISVGVAIAGFFQRVPGFGSAALWDATAPVSTTPEAALLRAVLFLAGAIAITLIVWSVRQLATQRFVLLATLCMAGIFAAITVIPSTMLAIAAYLALAVSATLCLRVREFRRRMQTHPHTVTLAISTLIAGMLAAWLLSLSSPWLWLITSIVVILLLLAAREIRIHPAEASSAAHRLQRVLVLCAALGAFIVLAFSVPSALSEVTGHTSASRAADAQAFGVLASGALLALFSAPLARFADARERHWALGVSAVGLLWGLAAGAQSSSFGAPPSGLVQNPASFLAAGSLLGTLAALSLIGARWNNPLLVAHRIALVAVTALAWASSSLAFIALRASGIDVPSSLTEIWPIALALAVLAASLAWSTARTHQAAKIRSRLDRVLLDAGAALVLLSALVVLGASGSGVPSWLLWLFAACGAAIISIDHLGLFNNLSRRHHWGWLALAFASLALWISLINVGVTAPEPYALPVAGALLAIAALISRFGTAGAPNSQPSSYAVAALAGAGVLLGLAPSALSGANGSPLRSLIVTAISGSVFLLAAVWHAPLSRTPLRGALLLSGGATAALAIATRALSTLEATPRDVSPVLEFWVLLGVGIFVATATVIARDSTRISTLCFALALFGGTAVELLAVASPTGSAEESSTRACALVFILSAAYAVFRWRPRTFIAQWLVSAMLGLAALVAAIYLASSLFVGRETLPFEIVTVPIAAAWLAGGAITLARVPTARSWPTMGGALVLLLIPSLLADYVEAPLWRVVGLGVVAILVLVAGLNFKLQAPFVMGSIVVLLHALAQLWPWISAAYNPNYWWLWFGAGGLLLIIAAARYEQRVRDVKNVTTAITSLR